MLDQNINTNVEQPYLEAVNLTKQYEDGVLALDHIAFRVMPGQIFTMLGGNGAGKTTTINLFLNFIDPSDGEARVKGIVTHKNPLEAKKHIAYVSENVMLYPHFSAIQNLRFFTRIGGRTDITDDDLHSTLFRVGLQEDVHHKKLKGFSKGMRQKCGIAIAILKNAPVILLDEPTSGLDPKAGREFVRLLEDLKGEGKAILMSTHDIFRAREISDMIAILDRGRLVMQKEASELAGLNLENLYLEYMSGQKIKAAG